MPWRCYFSDGSEWLKLLRCLVKLVVMAVPGEHIYSGCACTYISHNLATSAGRLEDCVVACAHVSESEYDRYHGTCVFLHVHTVSTPCRGYLITKFTV